ncbi:uncharacterized protein EV422DRAFT_546360 [Fimicolochytrium jonesii]|uniref:uncharacterized protein n=1 Tax=Fimicolochytrium jonesii TaxID=1396493 RepID=UPI0022FE502F|nr:uncharacterized protein EV422DRAFT_546360 [Fimicolochytrium jonesii]KAI8816346.1 hypothetical protein EV422DRAFT_546360 [Fimicolochytrium jonesii]
MLCHKRHQELQESTGSWNSANCTSQTASPLACSILVQRLGQSTGRLAMASLGRLYHRTMVKNPIATQAATAGLLFAAGDVVAQHGVEGKGAGDHDWARTGRLTLYGTFALGPAIAVWYRFLNRAVSFKNPLGATVTKVAMDQFMFAPINMFCFFTSMGFMEGKTWTQVKRKLSESYLEAYKANCMLWPPVQLCNFYFTPVNYQSLVVNTVALGWNSYMSWTNAKTRPSRSETEGKRKSDAERN